MNALLYIGTTLIWGSSWFAITFQISDVAVEVSAFYRFSLAAILQIMLMSLLGKLPWVPVREHGWFVMQGWLLFCFNFLLFYNAATFTTSGLIAVVFSMATIFNSLNGFVFHRKVPTLRAICGAALGIAGVCAIFWHDLFGSGSSSAVISTGPLPNGELSSGNVTGLLLAVAGTFCFSLGNMVSQHQQKQGRKVMTANSYALAYGSVTLGLWCLYQGYDFEIDHSTLYLGSLAFLVIPGTIVAFTLYLNLVGRVGAEKAAYCTVLAPIIALSLSTIFEGYRWTLLTLVGVALALIGNLVVFAKPRRSAPRRSAPPG
jgi:drug/metabolite transporter (DMT)-like permease